MLEECQATSEPHDFSRGSMSERLNWWRSCTIQGLRSRRSEHSGTIHLIYYLQKSTI